LALIYPSSPSVLFPFLPLSSWLAHASNFLFLAPWQSGTAEPHLLLALSLEFLADWPPFYLNQNSFYTQIANIHSGYDTKSFLCSKKVTDFHNQELFIDQTQLSLDITRLINNSMIRPIR